MILRILLVMFCLSASDSMAQNEKPGVMQLRRFPVIAGLQFQNFAMPFRDIKSNFTHPGVYAGSEIALNKKKNLYQNAIAGAYRNKEAGNGLYLYSQFCYRPFLYKKIFLTVKGGLGYLRIAHPAQAYKFSGGEWKKVNGGKSQLIIPFEISIGYRLRAKKYGILTPYASWQLSPALFYNKTIPLNFYSGIMAGVHIRLYKR